MDSSQDLKDKMNSLSNEEKVTVILSMNQSADLKQPVSNAQDKALMELQKVGNKCRN